MIRSVWIRLRRGGIFGKFMILCGLLCAVPMLTSLFYPAAAGELEAFALPAGLSILAGLRSCWKNGGGDQDAPRPTQIQKGGVFVLRAWLYGIVVGALPFVLAGQLTWVQSLFESVSGWTTTGLSVIEVTQASPMFLFHRGFMQYCGGLGFVMVMTLFIQNKQSMNLFQAEGHCDQLTPNLSRTVRLIVLMYTMFLLLGTAAYVLAGMNFFDSLIHAMCALSTGGFSTRTESIGFYQSPLIEFITIVLMLIGTTNFAALYLLMRRQARRFLAVSEVRFMGLVLAAAIPLTGLTLFCAAYADLPGSFRIAFFEVVSALSTTGFSTVGYANWPQAAVFVLIVMMLIGGGIGSTAGGLKLTRVYLMLRGLGDALRRRSSPAQAVSCLFFNRPQGRAILEPKLLADTSCFVFCYFLIYLAGTFLLMITADCSLIEAMFDFASALGTVGLSIGITGLDTPALALTVEMAGMLLGRLEIFILLSAIRAGFQRIKAFVWR